jgi:adenylylsulfate kinase-like enzyme
LEESCELIIWLAGLPGTGKTTLARYFVAKMKNRGFDFILLDGDDLRDALGARSRYDKESRIQLAQTYALLASLISKQGFNVVVSTVSLFKEVYAFNRQNLEEYHEVFLEVDLKLLKNGPRQEMYLSDSSSYLQGIVPEFPNEPHLHLKAFTLVERDGWLGELTEYVIPWLSHN